MTKDWQKYRSVSSDDVGVVEVNCDTEHPGQLKMFNDCDSADPYGFYYHQQARHADLKKVMRARDEVIKTTKALADDIRKQVGGNHYNTMKIQPIDYIMENNLGYLEANVIKYVSRHGSKNGVEDIDKAIHYLEMIKEKVYG